LADIASCILKGKLPAARHALAIGTVVKGQETWYNTRRL
jgi:hypothetical protein